MDNYPRRRTSSNNVSSLDLVYHHPHLQHAPSMSTNHPQLRPRYPQQQQPMPQQHSPPDIQYSQDSSIQMVPIDPEDGMPGASDFVRKLFRMLEDPAFSSIVCWGTQKDCFIVKDMTEFTKVILPRLFKHSNFASFVRQLNKYDFHKVKNTDENAYGEHCWTFRHPKFRADHLEGLEDIKRKSAPTRKSSGRVVTSNTRDTSPSASPTTAVDPSNPNAVHSLQNQIDQLLQTQHDMKSHIVSLESNYRSVLDEMAVFQRNMANQDALIQNLLQYFVSFDQSKPGEPNQPRPGSLPSHFVPSEETQRLMSETYSSDDVAKASLQQLTELSRRASNAYQPSTSSNPNNNPVSAPSQPPRMNPLPRLQISPSSSANHFGQGTSPELTPPAQSAAPIPSTPDSAAMSDWYNHKGLQVLTVGHLMPRPSQQSGEEEMEVEEQVMPSTTYPNPPPAPSARLRVRRKTYVPGWAVPPRVLLVEDDAVSRKLSSKFLQVLGVTTDVAVDGDAAVKQMSLEHYDLVLMDIVMPRLDGVSATSLIRQFDHRTPIISMTSNSCPQDILNYYSHGMNDILPKPFTRDGLFSMLEKHLTHLKAMSQLSQIPHSLTDNTERIKEVDESSGLKSDDSSRSFPVDTFFSSSPTVFTSINPIAGLGVADDQYASMLSSMTGDLFSNSSSLGVKRPAQDATDKDGFDPHPSKRGRFETIE